MRLNKYLWQLFHSAKQDVTSSCAASYETMRLCHKWTWSTRNIAACSPNYFLTLIFHIFFKYTSGAAVGIERVILAVRHCGGRGESRCWNLKTTSVGVVRQADIRWIDFVFRCNLVRIVVCHKRSRVSRLWECGSANCN